MGNITSRPLDRLEAPSAKDKSLDSFFNMEKFMEERWLLDELRERKETLRGLLETDSSIARSVLHKISTSETAVKSFIKDEDLAQTILTSQAIRDKLRSLPPMITGGLVVEVVAGAAVVGGVVDVVGGTVEEVVVDVVEEVVVGASTVNRARATRASEPFFMVAFASIS